MKGEEWAKVEILKMLDDLAGNREIMEYGTERSYGDDTGNRCDIVIKDIEGTEYWIEMKAFPTNYCTNVFPHKGRPITDFIDDCREGIRRVVQVKVHDRIPCFLFLAYPFPSQTEQREWVGHLTKLRGLGLTALRTLRIQLNNESEARVYLLT